MRAPELQHAQEPDHPHGFAKPRHGSPTQKPSPEATGQDRLGGLSDGICTSLLVRCPAWYLPLCGESARTVVCSSFVPGMMGLVL